MLRFRVHEEWHKGMGLWKRDSRINGVWPLEAGLLCYFGFGASLRMEDTHFGNFVVLSKRVEESALMKFIPCSARYDDSSFARIYDEMISREMNGYMYREH
jgi:hypothetical protein